MVNRPPRVARRRVESLARADGEPPPRGSFSPVARTSPPTVPFARPRDASTSTVRTIARDVRLRARPRRLARSRSRPRRPSPRAYRLGRWRAGTSYRPAMRVDGRRRRRRARDASSLARRVKSRARLVHRRRRRPVTSEARRDDWTRDCTRGNLFAPTRTGRDGTERDSGTTTRRGRRERDDDDDDDGSDK